MSSRVGGRKIKIYKVTAARGLILNSLSNSINLCVRNKSVGGVVERSLLVQSIKWIGLIKEALTEFRQPTSPSNFFVVVVVLGLKFN